MKKTILILMLVPQLCLSQSFNELITQYEKECNEIIKDTISQQGIVNYEYIPEKNSKGIIDRYVIQIKDTTWEKPDCPKYKFNEYSGLTFSSGTSISLKSSELQSIYYPVYIQETMKIYVSRDYICECKKREIVPFSENFWNWIKTK